MIIIRCSDSEKSLTLGFFFFSISVKLKNLFLYFWNTERENIKHQKYYFNHMLYKSSNINLYVA